jgi:hypothetical protein
VVSFVLRSRGETYEVISASLAPRDRASGDRVEAREAAELLVRLWREQPEIHGLRGLTAELWPGWTPRYDSEAVTRVAEALRSGRLALMRGLWLRPVYPSGGSGPPVKPSEPEGPETPPDETHWIEVRLIDEDGAALPNRAYVLVGPDGTERRGFTDSLGTVRWSQLTAGACKFSLPNVASKS